MNTIVGKRRVRRGKKSAQFLGQKATKRKDSVCGAVSFAVAKMDTAVPLSL